MFMDFMQFQRGGSWLGAVRNWIQRKRFNGSRVTWGSLETLEPPMTVRDVEDAAKDAAWAAYQDGLKESRKALTDLLEYVISGRRYINENPYTLTEVKEAIKVLDPDKYERLCK